MSHITKVETQITDLDAAEQALVDLGLEVGRNARISGWLAGAETMSLACVRMPNENYGIGLRPGSDGAYEVCADWWYVNRSCGIAQEDFMQRLSQRYAYLKVVKTLDENGFRVVTESLDAQKSIRLEVVKWR